MLGQSGYISYGNFGGGRSSSGFVRVGHIRANRSKSARCPRSAARSARNNSSYAFARYWSVAFVALLTGMARLTDGPLSLVGKKETNALVPPSTRNLYLVAVRSPAVPHNRSLRSGPPRAYRHAVQFLTPFIDDTNRTAHIIGVLRKIARNPGSVSVRAFQIGEMSPIVVHVV